MKPPGVQRLFEALDATWAPAALLSCGPWTLREGRGGGQRVSAATARGAVAAADISAAERGMRELNQHPIFMIRPGENDLDALLAEQGYEIVDPVVAYAAPVARLAAPPGPARALPAWPPLAAQLEFWAGHGVGPGRVAVMERVEAPKTAILGRKGDRPAGAVFAALDGAIAMTHALAVSADARRQGVGRMLMKAAAHWAAGQGAEWVVLMVTRGNAPANALYRSLGMEEVAHYHYRRAPKTGS